MHKRVRVQGARASDAMETMAAYRKQKDTRFQRRTLRHPITVSVFLSSIELSSWDSPITTDVVPEALFMRGISDFINLATLPQHTAASHLSEAWIQSHENLRLA